LGTITEVEGRAALDGIPLACPNDKQPLSVTEGALQCPRQHRYPLVGDIPILLDQEVPDSHPYFEESRRAAQASGNGASPDATSAPSAESVDPFVQQEIVKTNGILYRGVLGQLRRYPIPNIPLPRASAGESLLDVGCNWGRWSMAADQHGYRTIGIDPGIAGVQAAYRVAAALGRNPSFVVGDGRSLPFPDGTFDVVFSYSVLQHFSKQDARLSVNEAARVTRPGGKVLVQLANLFGVRQLYNQARDSVRGEQNPFRVRRWTPGEMLSAFHELVGPSRLFADGYFSLNAQASDVDLLRPFPRAVVQASQALKHASLRFPPLARLADSVFIEATRAG
jgi:SAM-dependent methyltransferase